MVSSVNGFLERMTRRFPTFLRRNFRLKALAFALALVAWTVVVYASDPPDTRTVDVPVPTDNLASKYRVQPLKPQVSVRLRGTHDHLQSFDPTSLTVTAAFDRVRSLGEQDIPVTVVNSDPDVELDAVPSAVTVIIDQLDSVSLPVTIAVGKDRTGKALNPPAGYEIGDRSATPAQVTVTGSRHRLQGIQGLHADAEVDLSSAKTTYVASEDVILRDAAGTRITDLAVSPNSVSVRVVVTSHTVTRASAVVPDLVGNVGFGRVLSGVVVSPQSFVVLTGPQDLLNQLDSVSTQPVRLSSLFSGQTVSVKVNVPQGVTADPSTVDVQVFFTTLPPPTPTPTSSPAPPPPTPTPTPTPVPTPTPTPTP